MQAVSIRGAITVNQNSKEAILEATQLMLEEILKANEIEQKNIIDKKNYLNKKPVI